MTLVLAGDAVPNVQGRLPGCYHCSDCFKRPDSWRLITTYYNIPTLQTQRLTKKLPPRVRTQNHKSATTLTTGCIRKYLTDSNRMSRQWHGISYLAQPASSGLRPNKAEGQQCHDREWREKGCPVKPGSQAKRCCMSLDFSPLCSVMFAPL